MSRVEVDGVGWRWVHSLVTPIVNNEIHVSMVSETKLNQTFATSQFLMRGYSAPFRKDRTSGKEKKWLLSCSYNSHGNNVCTHLQIIGKTLDKLSASYDNIIHLGDFNVEPEEAKMSEFLNMYSLKNLVSQKQRCQIFTNLH